MDTSFIRKTVSEFRDVFEFWKYFSLNSENNFAIFLCTCSLFLHLISSLVSRSWRSREFSPRFRYYWSRRDCGWTLIIRSDQTLSTERERANQWGSKYNPILCYLFNYWLPSVAMQISAYAANQGLNNKGCSLKTNWRTLRLYRCTV